MESIARSHVLVETPDGRLLDVRASGRPSDAVLLFRPGTPGCGLPFRPIEAAVLRHHLRLVSFARPGFAGSTRWAGRSVVDVAAYAAAVLDALGVGRCLTAGWSGGAPHALACAARVPDRVTAALSIACMAPRDADLGDWYAGLAGSDAADLLGAIAGRFPPVDVEAIAPFADELVANFAEALRVGVDGFVDDWLAFVRPWGVDVARIERPTFVWAGDLDGSAPTAHTAWLGSHLAGAVTHLEPSAGHLSIVVDHIDRMLDELADAG